MGVHHVQITVPGADIARARKFYLELLQFAEIEKPAALKKNGGFWMMSGNLQIHVGVEEGVERTKTKGHLCYQVDDIESWRGKVTDFGLGSEIVDGSGIPFCARFEFRDPSGNRIEILQVLQTTA